VIAQIRAELLRQRSIRSNISLLWAMVGLVILVILLHALFLPTRGISDHTGQMMVIGQGQRLGTLFAALMGALSITAEFRYGTIRPILLATPGRAGVLVAKVIVSMLLGTVLGLTAMATAAAVGSAALIERGLALKLDGTDYSVLIAGSAAGAMLWAAIGVGVGTVVRNQVPALVGICTWLLFVEGLLFGDIGLSNYGRLLPGALARAVSGQDTATLFAPAIALLLLGLYAVAASVAGSFMLSRRDVA
jgi:ABC-2 type transport system permease protein